MDAAEVPSFGSFQLPDAVQEDREERSRDAGRKASRSSKHMSAFESSSSRPQGGEETQSSANWKDQKLKSGHERHNRSSHSSKRRRRHDSENESDADRSARKLRSARNRDERRASRSLRQLETESRSVRRPESSEEYIARVSSVHTASHVKRSVSNEVNLQHLEDSYFVDAKGDHKAATCGGLSASKLPRYQRFGDGCVLGLSRSLRISFSSARLDGKVLEILPKGGRRVRYLDKEERWRARQPAPLRIAPGTSPSSAAFGEYEALSESEVRGGARSASDDDPLPDYRDFHRKRTSASPRRDRREASPQDTSNKVESDSATILRARVSSLDVRVREDASDVEGWLQLAHVQAQLVKALSSSGNQSIRGHHRQHRAGAEASLAVLTRARRSNPRNASLELAYLRKGSLIWENEKCDKEWSALLKSGEMQGQRLGAVWVAYLEWSSRQAGPLSTFLEAVTKGLKALLSATWKAQLFEERQILEQALVTLWTTAVRHLSEAGYYERAFALVQAQLEVTFCAPLGLESQDEESHERLIDSFSQFWDDEGPRIGEEGAKGWANQYGHRDVPDAGASMPSIDPSSLPYRSSKSDDSVPWVERERARAGLRQKPARATATPLHGEDEVDPYAFILSSDVVQLVAVPITAPAVKSRVLDFALGYLGMSPGIAWAGDPAQSSAKFQGETRAGPTAMLALQQRFWPFSLSPTGGTESDVPLIAKTEGEVMGGLRQNNLSQPFDVPITCWAPRLPELYSTSRVELGSQWFTSVRTDDLQHADLETASNVLDHLPPDAGGLSRTIARFAFEHATRGHKAARSLARGELDANRDSMELWHAFAWLEESAGKLDSARLVYRSALDKLRADSRTLAVSEALPMLRDWAEMEWRARQNASAIEVLARAATFLDHSREQGAADPSALRQSFAAKGDLVSPMARGAIMSCRALLEHLVEGGIESYCKVIEHAMEYLKHGEDALEVRAWSSPRYAALESVYLSQGRFLWVYTNREETRSTGYRPLTVRNALTRAVQAFPNNTALLSLLAAHEMRAKVEGHLRSVLERHVLPHSESALAMSEHRTLAEHAARHSQAEACWLFAIYSELNLRSHPNEHTIRHYFERALTNDTASISSSATLWHLYLGFEIRLAIRADRFRGVDAHTSSSDEDVYRTGRRRRREASKQQRQASERAKRVLYRAIRACPFNRELYWPAFEPPLSQVMSHSELVDLARSMSERELRTFSSFTDLPSRDGQSRRLGGGLDSAAPTQDTVRNKQEPREDSPTRIKHESLEEFSPRIKQESLHEFDGSQETIELAEMEERRRLMPY